MIKDHKNVIRKGYLSTRLVIPPTNFSDNFATVGYLGLKNTLEKNAMNYTRLTIFQASQVKDKRQELNWKEKEARTV